MVDLVNEKGWLKNCFLWPRKGDEHMFIQRADEVIVPTLDGYAIIPKDEYEKLKKAARRLRAAKENGMTVGKLSS